MGELVLFQGKLVIRASAKGSLCALGKACLAKPRRFSCPTQATLAKGFCVPSLQQRANKTNTNTRTVSHSGTAMKRSLLEPLDGTMIGTALMFDQKHSVGFRVSMLSGTRIFLRYPNPR